MADPAGANLDHSTGVADIEGYPSRIGIGLRQLAMMDFKTRSNVIATVNAALKIFSNENVASVTSRTDFTLGDLRGIAGKPVTVYRSEEHTSELQSLMRLSYAVFCLKKKTTTPSICNIY